MSLRQSYTLIAPFYDFALDRATRAARRESLTQLPTTPSQVLLAGIGTGLDLPLLPQQHRYVGLDLTAAMLSRALPKAGALDFSPIQGDAQRLPLTTASCDAAVLHLILAVVPNPAACLAEAARVVRPGGSILIFDKFLRPGQTAPLRRLANRLMRHLATRLDVVFEDVMAEQSHLTVHSDRPALANGWFRHVHLRRQD